MDDEAALFARRLFDANGNADVTRILHRLAFTGDVRAPAVPNLSLSDAVDAARASQDPHELEVLATDVRPAVATAVADNPFAGAGALESVVRTAIAADIREHHVRIAFDRLPVDRACRVAAQAGELGLWLAYNLSLRLVRGGADLITVIDTLQDAGAPDEVVSQVAVGAIGHLRGRRLEQLGARLGGYVELRALVAALVSGSLRLTEPRAHRIADLSTQVSDDQLESVTFLLPQRRQPQPIASANPAAVDVLVAANTTLTHSLAALFADQPHTLIDLVSRCDDSQLPEVAHAAAADRLATHAIVDRLTFGVSPYLAGQTVNALVHALRARRAAGSEVAMVVAAAVRTRAVDEIWRHQHVLAFICDRDPQAAPPAGWITTLDPTAVNDLFHYLVGHLETSMPTTAGTTVLPPAVAELVDVVPALASRWDLFDGYPTVAAAVADRIRETVTAQIGSHPAGWEVVAGLAPTFDGTVTELALSARLLVDTRVAA